MCCTRLARNTGRKKSPSMHHRTNLSVYVFVTKARTTIGKKLVKQKYVLHICLQYGERRPTNGWELLASLGYPSKFQLVSRLGRVTARHSSSGRQSNFVALNRGHRLYLAGRPSRWTLAHILVRAKVVGPTSTHRASFVSDIAIFVVKRDVKFQLTN